VVAVQQKVRAAIPVDIADGAAVPLAPGGRETGLLRNVLEPAATSIPEQAREGASHQQNVEKAVVVVIQKGTAAAERRLDADRARELGIGIGDAGGGGDFLETHASRRRGRAGFRARLRGGRRGGAVLPGLFRADAGAAARCGEHESADAGRDSDRGYHLP
jgi:hypothetical protein